MCLSNKYNFLHIIVNGCTASELYMFLQVKVFAQATNIEKRESNWLCM